jgi:BirA family biotin operon repressor/biotin-[acetyl-CoA-carboxylase] ligase
MALPPFYRLEVHETLASTNDEAKRRAAAGAAEGALILARRQTAGRGRSGRTWTSPEGNLYVSLLLRPARPPGEAAQLSFVAALALAEAVAVPVALKWPNDVLARGRKLAGILLEGSDGWLVIGCGLNIASAPEGATCLRAEGSTASPDQALEAFGAAFLAWRARWLADGFAPIRTAWLARAAGLGAPAVARLGHETLHGTFADLDSDGALVLDMGGAGRRRIAAGEVYFQAA